MSIFSEFKDYNDYLFKESNSQFPQNDHFYFNDLFYSNISYNNLNDNNSFKNECYNTTDKEDKNTLDIFNNNKYPNIFEENSCNSLFLERLERQFTVEPMINESYITTKTSSIISKDENNNNNNSNINNEVIKEINDIKENNKKLVKQTSHKEDIYYKKDINEFINYLNNLSAKKNKKNPKTSEEIIKKIQTKTLKDLYSNINIELLKMSNKMSKTSKEK